MSGSRPAQGTDRFPRIAPAVAVVFPVEVRLPVVRCGHSKACDFDLRDRWVVRLGSPRRLLREGVNVLGDFYAFPDLGDETCFFMKFPLGSGPDRFPRLDSAGHYVPIPALLR